MPLPVKAGNVEVIAVPYIGGGGIGDFTATTINDHEVLLEWTIEPGTTEVMIRANYNDIPISLSDGVMVYQGTDFSYTDTSMNFEEYLGTLYYRIWAKSTYDIWIDYEVNTAEVEGIMLALILILVIITYFSYRVFNSYFCKVLTGMTWITIGVIRIIEDQTIWSNVTLGIVMAAIGVYIFFMVGYDLIKGE